PPAILSIFLGEQLTGVIGQIERGETKTSKSGGFIKIGVSSLPTLPRDATDRNRTSPFAFTGNKFEFRAVGSNQNCAGPNIVLNTIVAAAIDDICTSLEKDVSAKKDFNKSLQKILQKIVKEHKRILFNGDNYTDAWHAEAKKRGLPNLKTTPESLKILLDAKTVKLFGKYKVLSEKELNSRFEVYQKEYDEIIQVESEVAVTIAKTQVINAALEYQSELAETINAVSKIDRKNALKSTRGLLSDVCAKTEGALVSISRLEKAIKKGSSKEKIAALAKLREFVDALEGLVPDEKWPLATYAEMMFMM
ncbi:MAG: glutamine synthetase type III, partial [Candidatus Aureabacteria bacterium]|nr:glutamine synthetase type III [Candidatus Auribacterota bacterium]